MKLCRRKENDSGGPCTPAVPGHYGVKLFLLLSGLLGQALCNQEVDPTLFGRAIRTSVYVEPPRARLDETFTLTCENYAVAPTGLHALNLHYRFTKSIALLKLNKEYGSARSATRVMASWSYGRKQPDVFSVGFNVTSAYYHSVRIQTFKISKDKATCRDTGDYACQAVLDVQNSTRHDIEAVVTSKTRRFSIHACDVETEKKTGLSPYLRMTPDVLSLDVMGTPLTIACGVDQDTSSESLRDVKITHEGKAFLRYDKITGGAFLGRGYRDRATYGVKGAASGQSLYSIEATLLEPTCSDLGRYFCEINGVTRNKVTHATANLLQSKDSYHSALASECPLTVHVKPEAPEKGAALSVTCSAAILNSVDTLLNVKLYYQDNRNATHLLATMDRKKSFVHLGPFSTSNKPKVDAVFPLNYGMTTVSLTYSVSSASCKHQAKYYCTATMNGTWAQLDGKKLVQRTNVRTWEGPVAVVGIRSPECKSTIFPKGSVNAKLPGKPGVTQRPGETSKPDVTQRPGATGKPGVIQRPGVTGKPGVTQGPGKPGRPGVTQGPGEPGKPGVTQRPKEPGKPGVTQGPVEPGKPGVTRRPAKPGKPGVTQGPGEPGKPGVTQRPKEPSKPAVTQGPGKPGKPGVTHGPGEPGKPGVTQGPGKPGKPGVTQRPEEPSKPGVTQGPGKPGKPGVTRPGKPGKPGVTQRPEEPSKPGVTQGPGKPGKPGVTRRPEEPGKPGVTQGPGEPGKPGVTQRPKEPGKPGVTQGPGKPGRPGVTQGPGEPGKPGVTQRPTEPGKPGVTQGPGEPGKPGVTRRPEKPGKPGVTQGPREPGKPGVTRRPKEPSKPGVTQGPGKPGKPGVTQGPGEPGKPGVTQGPGKPGKPGVTQRPEEPSKPGVTQGPGKPGKPGVTQGPGKPGKPGVTQRPEEPSKPGVTQGPGKPGKPGVTQRPEEPGKPGVTQGPEEPSKPGVTQGPGKPGKPGVTRRPEEPGKPGVTQGPGEPGKPGVTQGPGKPGKPGVTQRPKEPGKPGVTQGPGETGKLGTTQSPEVPGGLRTTQRPGVTVVVAPVVTRTLGPVQTATRTPTTTTPLPVAKWGRNVNLTVYTADVKGKVAIEVVCETTIPILNMTSVEILLNNKTIFSSNASNTYKVDSFQQAYLSNKTRDGRVSVHMMAKPFDCRKHTGQYWCIMHVIQTDGTPMVHHGISSEAFDIPKAAEYKFLTDTLTGRIVHDGSVLAVDYRQVECNGVASNKQRPFTLQYRTNNSQSWVDLPGPVVVSANSTALDDCRFQAAVTYNVTGTSYSKWRCLVTV